VAAACARAGSALVHLSTDYVFDGTKRGAYVEDDPISPINVYGVSKAAGEAAVRASVRRHLILRTSWVYGARGQNFVKTMLRLAQQRKDIAVVDDQTGSPTAAPDLAAAIVQISKRLFGIAEPWGTYHLCGAGAVTWHGFAQAVMSLRKAPPADRPTLRPIDTHEFAAAARRPTNSRLDCRRAAATFGVACPAWYTSLARLLPEIEAQLSSAFGILLGN
jgi:dTDP-4-dehydrorhamnose reductase